MEQFAIFQLSGIQYSIIIWEIKMLSHIVNFSNMLDRILKYCKIKAKQRKQTSLTILISKENYFNLVHPSRSHLAILYIAPNKIE